jgi:hypothetical protein
LGWRPNRTQTTLHRLAEGVGGSDPNSGCSEGSRAHTSTPSQGKAGFGIQDSSASTPPRRWSGVRSTRTGKCVVPTAKRKTDDEAEIDLMRHRQCEDLDRGRSEDDPSNALYRVSLVAQSGELAIPREALCPLRFSGFRRRYAGVTFADVAKRVS